MALGSDIERGPRGYAGGLLHCSRVHVLGASCALLRPVRLAHLTLNVYAVYAGVLEDDDTAGLERATTLGQLRPISGSDRGPDSGATVSL